MNRTPTSSVDPLQSLLNIISNSVFSLQASFLNADLKFPCLNKPFAAGTEEDFLATNDDVRRAVQHITAACEQLVSMIRTPMEVICDAAMCYHLPSCLSVLENGNVVEILDEAGDNGVHVDDIVKKMHVPMDSMLLSRILRLLATHHILLEVKPNVFSNNRISSFISTHKLVSEIIVDPNAKYDGTNGVAAFIGMCTQDIYKAAAFLPDSLGLSLHPTRASDIIHTPSRAAMPLPSNVNGTNNVGRITIDPPSFVIQSALQLSLSQDGVDFKEISKGGDLAAKKINGWISEEFRIDDFAELYSAASRTFSELSTAEPSPTVSLEPPYVQTPFNFAFRTPLPYFSYLEATQDAFGSNQSAMLRRFGAAMQGSAAWEMKGVVAAFDWVSLMESSVQQKPCNDGMAVGVVENGGTQSAGTVTVVDVGGGIGACCMALVRAFPEYSTDFNGKQSSFRNWRFVIQDRKKVVEMGREVWEKEGLDDLVQRGVVNFVDHDFFTPQQTLTLDSGLPIEKKTQHDQTVFLLRAIAHDWPDEHVKVILTHLRNAATSTTILILGDHTIPYACVDDSDWVDVEGGFRTLTDSQDPSASILLPNLGRGSANAYWVDLCMQVVFGSQERTLGHIINLTQSAGWEVVRVNRVGRGLFAYIVCRPMKDWK